MSDFKTWTLLVDRIDSLKELFDEYVEDDDLASDSSSSIFMIFFQIEIKSLLLLLLFSLKLKTPKTLIDLIIFVLFGFNLQYLIKFRPQMFNC